MKSFYTSTRATFYSLDSDKIEIRTYHHVFWGVLNFTTSRTAKNKLI